MPTDFSHPPVAAPVPRTCVGIGWRQPHYAVLMERRPAIDFLEVHSENFFGAGGAALRTLERGRELYPVSLHGVGLSLGSASGLDPWHVEQLAELVARIDPVRVSDHASFARVPTVDTLRHACDLLPLACHEAALQVLCDNVAHVQDRLKRPLVVENVSAYVHWRGATMSEPEFLNRLVTRTGCGLLVDVNNVYVNALNQRRHEPELDLLAFGRQWLDAIAPASVHEIHLAGHLVLPDLVIDDHGREVCDDVWQLYAHAVARFGAVPTLLEWDTHLPPLDTLLDEALRARQIQAEVAHA